jgi:8-oxo-dGTP pyrophosphatase MutT (NUDIX family)
MTEPKVAAGIVAFLVWRHQFLLILRDDKPDILSPNTWCPVTGGREDDETLWDAACRECKEEIGIIPHHFTLLGVSAKGNGFCFGRLSDEEKESIVLGEGQRYSFYSFDSLSYVDISGAMKGYLERYRSVFKKMAESEQPPFGSELGLATWNG